MLQKWCFNKIAKFILLIIIISFTSCNSIESLYRAKSRWLESNQKESFLKPYADVDYSKQPLVEYLLDSKDSMSINYFNHYKKLCDYTKLPFNFKPTSRWNAEMNIEKSTKVLIIKNTKSINTKSIDSILSFVANGGTLLLPASSEDRRFGYFIGLAPNAKMEFDVTSRGFYDKDALLTGIGNKFFKKNYGHFAYSKTNFSDKVKTLFWSDDSENFPVVLENKIGKGKVVYYNTTVVFEKNDRGLLFLGLLRGLQGIPYPVANTNTIFLDDFPSPLYDIKKEPIKSEFNLSMNDFVHKVWWSDMTKLSKKYDIKYTAMLTFDYNNFRKAPFTFKQWDFAKAKVRKKKYTTTSFLVKDLIKKGHEPGFHGYNHISLLKSEWKDTLQIALAFKAVKKKWIVSEFGDYPITYVPPSNQIDEYGIKNLKNSFNSLKYMSSLYIGNSKLGSNREFDFDPYHKNLFDYPRISSGFYLDETDAYDIYSTFLYTGIWNHFVHPDDVYQIKANNNEKYKYDYESRNKYNLGWKKKKKSLYGAFSKFVSNYKINYPNSRFLTAKDAVPIVIDWRASRYGHFETQDSYTVKEQTNLFEINKPVTWFVYFESVSGANKDEIDKQSKTFSQSDFFGGKLVNLTASNHLTFTRDNIGISDGEYKTITQDFVKFCDDQRKYITGIDSKYSEDEFKKRLEDEKKKLLEIMLSDSIIDPKIWNKYAYYASWEEKGDDVWQLLDKHCKKHPSQHNVNYSFELSRILGYSSNDLQKHWIELQYKWNPDDLKILKEYLQIIISTKEYKEIGDVLNKIHLLEPICSNQEAYISHLLLYDKDKGFEELKLINPSQSFFNDQLVSDICWAYVNNQGDYQNAINWSEYSDLIGFDTKLSWMYELKQYIELEEEYQRYMKKNPEDYSVMAKMVSIYHALGKFKEAWDIAQNIKDEEIRAELKEFLNKEIVYVDEEIQEVILKEPSDFLTEESKEIIKDKLKKMYGDYAETKSTLETFVKDKTSFQNLVSYNDFDKKKNLHSYSISHKDLFGFNINELGVNENQSNTVYGIHYKFKKKPNKLKKDFSYYYGAGLEYDENSKLFYNAKLGYTISPKRGTFSLEANYKPVNFKTAYDQNVYEMQLNSYYNKFYNLLEIESYFEANYYDKIGVFGTNLNTKLKAPRNREKMFKTLPFIEGALSFSNIENEVMSTPVYLFKNRFYGGGGIDLNIGKEEAKIIGSVIGGYYFDSYTSNFINLKGNLEYNFLKYAYLKGSYNVFFQDKFYTNVFQFGVKYIF